MKTYSDFYKVFAYSNKMFSYVFQKNATNADYLYYSKVKKYQNLFCSVGL
jgi:hypothetical protein